MAKDEVLARVSADLQRGHYHPALQRLASLTAAFPADLEVRAARAALNRQVGNVVEAGRWGFLTEDATEAEIAAFERAFPSVWARLYALKLRADPTDSLGPAGRSRLARLTERAEREGPAPVSWTDAGPRPEAPSSWRDGVPCLLAFIAGVIALGLAGIGLLTVIRWLV
ncbi:DUF6584 family protein [Asanoa iriomotensis]|uniref:Uncharacterized protein n=1 Tax=Asanoa iriomotensis TaxID=234613 RepID=A0ABQ4BZZ5_9ACTN|nr:DUF6584 family protein [Asanoa iriomotensis]GIF56102.1 hypothetical protein Air01nite_21970 [Asanoa iriomotensis]